jgi:GTPase
MEIPTEFKSGFVALVGRPNVGKSTLMNVFVGQKVAAVSPRPQTTRQRQLGILTTDQYQVIFMDTPGLHVPAHKLGEYMNQVAEESLRDADVIVWLVEAPVDPKEEDYLIGERLQSLRHKGTLIVAINKIDLVSNEDLPMRTETYRRLIEADEIVAFSATTGIGRDELLDKILDHLPEGAPLYDPEQVTDYYEREIAAELIREAGLFKLRDEIPHGVAVRIDEYTERNEEGAYIHATILVERESHKGIVIGKGGDMLKRIGSAARLEIESMSGRKIFLELRVKVNQNWRNKPDALRWLGYTREKE